MARMTRSMIIDDADREIAGFVEVDSGQIVIADPTHISSHWHDGGYMDLRRFRHRESGRVLQYLRDFANFESPIESEDGLTMNALLRTGEWEQLENPRVLGLSYEACSRATLSSDLAGQIVLPDSSIAAGVAVSTNRFHPLLPVFIERYPDGSPARIIIDLPPLETERDHLTDEQLEKIAAYHDALAELRQAMLDDVVASARDGGNQPAGRE